MQKKSKLQQDYQSLLRWQNQNQFLQDRHGNPQLKESSSCNNPSCHAERIAVALMPSPTFKDASEPAEKRHIALYKNGFDLLCWTINMAARPYDHVIALRPGPTDISANEHEAINSCFKPLQDLCNVKEVRLDVIPVLNHTAEKHLAEAASAINATMLVVTISGHHLLRHAQRKGNFLARHVRTGCSVLVVKDFKILFYKDNQFRAATRRNSVLGEGYGIDVCFQHNGSNFSCDKVWPDSRSAPPSPRRVLDSQVALSDSDESHVSSLHASILSRSCSRSSALVELLLEDEDGLPLQTTKSFRLKRSRWQYPSSRALTFPSSRQQKSTPTTSLRKSVGTLLKSYMSSIWSARTLRKMNARTPHLVSGAANVWKSFTFEEILTATNHFDPDNLVGNGGHAEVYRGILPNGQVVAVKRSICDENEEQKIAEFLTELGILGHISHPNITSLIGYCIEKGLHLIFPFSEQGCLASWLYGENLVTIGWETRYKVAVGTARGLNYLHNGCHRHFIHRDIKASNILLGPNFEPQISDFGLAKWLPDQSLHHVLTPIEGTFGYLAPEYVTHGLVDEKADVFAFGVLLLELITGRKALSKGSQSSLVLWARPFLETLSIAELVDPQLDGRYDLQEMQCMMMVAALCVQQSPLCRPSMSQVLQLLTDETSSDMGDPQSILSSCQSFSLQDSFFDSEYTCTNYQSDMERHREIALQF